MEFFTVRIKTLSPIVLTATDNDMVMTESRDYISGSILRGMLASRFIEMNRLNDKAHEDLVFRKLFFGGLRFVDAYPVNDGKRSFVLPLSLQKAKVSVGTQKNEERLLDVLKDKPKAGYKPIKGFAVVTGNAITKITVVKQIKLHMSRTSEQERLSGCSLKSGIYNYEAVASEQEFEGIVIGDKTDLKHLLEGLGTKTFTCRVGRSKFTEYGKCQMIIGEINKIKLDTVQGDTVYVRLETPWMPLLGEAVNANELIKPFVDKLATALNTNDITIEKVIGVTEIVTNFVGIWRLKRAERQALAAGSVFSLKKPSGWTDADMKVLCDLMYQGQGSRKEEGFGQLRCWNVETPTLCKTKKVTIERKRITSERVKEIAGNIALQRIMARIRLEAEKDVHRLQGNLETATQTFARLENILGERSNLVNAKERFQTELKRELREGSVFDQQLKNLTLNGCELKDYLGGKRPMPYTVLDFRKEVPEDLAEDIGFNYPGGDNGAVFYEYWLWFFRHGRKYAVTEKREKNDRC